jgi:hypothetical protein
MYRSVFRVSPSGELVLGRPRPYQDRVWRRFYDDLLGPDADPVAMVEMMEQMDQAYGRWAGAGHSQPGPGRGVPRAGFRCRKYLGAEFGASGASARRHAWEKSSLWEFWIPGCLSQSCQRFRDYFRISRERFDMIYEAAAQSGLFGLNPSEPQYANIHPEGPHRPGHHQDDKKIPLCLRMAASLRRVASGDTFASLAHEFRIAESTLCDFDKQFWAWFREHYWEAYVTGQSGVGFDDLASIQAEELLFRQMGLPGFITCMDGVHCAWEKNAYQIRYQYIGKEGFPTIVINVHCTATGRILYAGPVFPGAHNDKTIVRSDELVMRMQSDPLFKDCKWATVVPDGKGGFQELSGCMALCDGGYHNWLETMSGPKQPISPEQAQWAGRYSS